MILNNVLKEMEILSESGLYNIKQIAKDYKKAEGYFHIDLDGVTSAISI